jgi:iron complex outermembrane receptor protein
MQNHIHKYSRRFGLLVALVGWPCIAQASHTDLSQVSLEDLMNIQVTSVSKKEQKLSQTGAAVFVITQEDIRRSGATNIPDLLRLAPGVDVARVDSNRWAISIRGFNDPYANKVLVLVDGRSVYNPSFSGVFWDMVDVPLEDIERIEVIRGPGGTVWGANAVNGVINIITKTASATPGTLISAGTGSEETAQGLMQYGGQIGQIGSYRVFGRYFNIQSSLFPNTEPAADGWQAGHAGFRSDWNLSDRNSLTVQGDFTRTQESQTVNSLFSNALPFAKTFNDPIVATGANVLAHWNHTLANGSQMSLQVYDDYSRHVEEGFSNTQQTVDVDLEHHIALGSRNDLVWGLGARVIHSDYGAGYAFLILPSERTDHLMSGFLQDEVRLTNSLSLTVGAKVEHNSFTGAEFEPSVQLVWAPNSSQVVWLSAAQAVRQPSAVDVGIIDDLFSLPLGPTYGIFRAIGNPKIQAEQLRDFEAGYRHQVSKRLTLDVALFAGHYHGLDSIAAGSPYFITQNSTPYVILPYVYGNGAAAWTYGAEFFANWKVTGHWRISPGYSYFHMNLDGSPSSVESPPGRSPNHQFQLRSLLDLPHHLEWDNTLEYVSRLTAGNIPSYVRANSRFGWRFGESMELSVVGQNLFSPRHKEFANPLYPTVQTLVERSVFGKVTWRF